MSDEHATSGSVAADPGAEAPPRPADEPPRKKKRRWLRFLIGLVLVILILAATAPYWLSTGPGTRLVTWIGNSYIDGRMDIADLSLSWTGPCRIEGLSIRDNQDREVLTARLLSWSRGVWHGLTAWEKLGQVEIDEPLVALYVQEDGRTSIQDVFAELLEADEEAEPPDEDQQKRVQSLEGTLDVRNGTIRLIDLDGRETRCEKLEFSAEIRTLAHVKAKLSLRSPTVPIPTSGPATKPAKPVKPPMGTGTLVVEIGASRADHKAAFVVGAKGLLRVVDADGKELDYSPVGLDVEELALAGPDNLIKLKSLLVKAKTLLRLDVTDVLADLDKETMDARLKLEADIKPCLAAAAPVAQWEQPPAFAGKLVYEAEASTEGKKVRISGTNTVTGFQAGSGKEAFAEDWVKLVHRAEIDTDASVVRIKAAELTSKSKFLTVKTEGTVSDYHKNATLDLQGTYDGEWRRLTVLLHEFLPATKGLIALAGSLDGRFTIAGPASNPEVKPVFRGVAADCGLGWESGQALGLRIEKARFSPSMKDAKITLPDTRIGLSGGQMQLRGTFDLSGEPPLLTMPGQTQLLDRVQINKEFGRQFLSYVNPLFAQVASLEGRVSMRLEDVRLPMGEAIKKQGTGKGQLDIRGLKLRPTGVLGKLVEFGGAMTGGSYDVQFEQVKFELKDGRISYENLTMIFPGDFDMRFRGSVGFDDSLDLLVSLPVRAALLRGFGVKGPVEQYAQVLGKKGTRVEIPIVGKRLAPRLGEVDMQAIMKDAAKSLLPGGVPKLPGGLLDKLPNPLRKPDSDSKKKPDKDKSKGGLLDKLGETLEGGLGGSSKKSKD